ncbi:MAG: molybdenum cofactor biosynthesis protein, partial [Methylococcales bacterium]|nr:molybdenum cofactor biosynthesis protein [Methylococcales bacterium]
MTAIQREFIPANIAVLTVSDSRTEADDKSGKLLVSRLNDAGHQLFEKTIVKDDIFAVRAVISNWIAEPDAQVV